MATQYYFLSYAFVALPNCWLSPENGFSNCVSDIHPFEVFNYIQRTFMSGGDNHVFKFWTLLSFQEISVQEYVNYSEKYYSLEQARKKIRIT